MGIKEALLQSDEDVTLNNYLKNTLHAFGVATTDDKCRAVPLYDMQAVFKKGHVCGSFSLFHSFVVLSFKLIF